MCDQTRVLKLEDLILIYGGQGWNLSLTFRSALYILITELTEEESKETFLNQNIFIYICIYKRTDLSFYFRWIIFSYVYKQAFVMFNIYTFIGY